MAKHAKLCPPSGWDRWSQCSASVDLQTNEGSEFAALGTAAHYLADTCFTSFFNNPATAAAPADYKGTEIWVPDAEDEAAGEHEHFLLGDEEHLTGWTFEVDQEMVDNVQKYMDEVLMQERDYAQSETEVPIGHITCEEGATGHADVIRVNGSTLATHDLKYGQGVKVYAKDNGQQVLYLLGAMKELDWYGDFDKFEVHIHQPRLGHHDVWYLSKEELEEWAKKINKVAYPIVVEGLRGYGPSTKGCRFCDGRRECEARSEFAMASVDEFPLPDDGEELPTPSQHMADMLDRLEFIEQWCKDVWKYATEMVKEDEDAIPGWGLYPGRGSRKIIDEEKVKSRLRKRKFKIDDYSPRKFISAAQLEKLVGKEVYNKAFNDVVKHYDGTPKLGRDRGGRKKAQEQTLEAFESHED